jgi:hypothetical protein
MLAVYTAYRPLANQFPVSKTSAPGVYPPWRA